MKNQNHDVIMICKGLYDETKYKTALDALNGYYMREYAMGQQYATNERILYLLLLPVFEQYLSKRIVSNILVQLCLDLTNRSDIGEFISQKIISAIMMLRVTDADGTIIVDVSDYKENVI